MRKLIKPLLGLLMVFCICFTMYTPVFADVVVDGGGVPPVNPNPPTSGDRVGGCNWWYLVPQGNNSLILDVYMINTHVNDPQYSVWNGCWAYPTAKSLRIRSNGDSGLSGVTVKDNSSYYASLCYISRNCKSRGWGSSESNTWDTYAQRLNAYYDRTDITAAMVVEAVDDFLAPRVVNDTWGNSCVWYNVGSSKLTYIDLTTLPGFENPPYDVPEEHSNEERQTEYQWVLQSLRGTTAGNTYDIDTNGLDEYNALHNFSNTDAKYNNLNPLSSAFASTPGLSYTRDNNYSVNTTNNTTATYKRIKRVRTRTKYWTTTYHYEWQNGQYVCTSTTTDGPYYTAWSSWSYSIDSSSDVTNNNSLNHTVYEPHFYTYNWVDLTSEQFTHDTALQTGSGVKPIDYKDADGFSNTNLNVTLNSGKTAGDMFEILSDNNPKEVGLNFTDIFGVPGLTTTRSATVNTTYVVSDTFHYGPQMNPASSTPLISIQRTGPTSGQETFNHEYISYNGSPVNFAAKIRSIKYGTYTLGDAKHSNYWYTTLRLATVNNFGSRYSVSAPGMVSSPSGSAISITPTDLRNDIALSASYIQPVLVGDIDVKDAAGN